MENDSTASEREVRALKRKIRTEIRGFEFQRERFEEDYDTIDVDIDDLEESITHLSGIGQVMNDRILKIDEMYNEMELWVDRTDEENVNFKDLYRIQRTVNKRINLLEKEYRKRNQDETNTVISNRSSNNNNINMTDILQNLVMNNTDQTKKLIEVMGKQKIETPRFDGKAENFDQWLEIVKSNVKLYGNDSERCLFIKSLLEGEAKKSIDVQYPT